MGQPILDTDLLNYLRDLEERIRQLESGSQLKAGDIIRSASTTPFPNTLPCNGAAYSRTDYSLLYSTIGSTYGDGDGSTTFNVPDFPVDNIVARPVLLASGVSLSSMPSGSFDAQSTNLLCFTSSSGYATSGASISYTVTMAGSVVTTVTWFTNELSSHKSSHGKWFSVTLSAKGTTTWSAAMTAGTCDSNDFMTLLVLEQIPYLNHYIVAG